MSIISCLRKLSLYPVKKTSYSNSRLCSGTRMNIIQIDSYPIKLGQLLKLANVVQDGFEAKALVQNGSIQINGRVETRRGRKLFKNDQLELEDGTSYLLA